MLIVKDTCKNVTIREIRHADADTEWDMKIDPNRSIGPTYSSHNLSHNTSTYKSHPFIFKPDQFPCMGLLILTMKQTDA
jgi:hypothetical protein